MFLSPHVQAGLEKEAEKSDFEFGKNLGSGTFGTVFKVKNKHTQRIYAIK